MCRVSPAVNLNNMSRCSSIDSNNTGISNVVGYSKFMTPIQKLLEKIKDLSATTDRDLGKTDTLKMRIDTDNQDEPQSYSFETLSSSR